MSSASGAKPPDPLTRGFAPGPHWGAKPPDPHIRSRYRARHEAPKVLSPHCFTLQIAPCLHLYLALVGIVSYRLMGIAFLNYFHLIYCTVPLKLWRTVAS